MAGRFQLVGEIAWGGQSEDALVALSEEGPLEQAAALVVEKIFEPTIFDEGGNDDDHAALRILFRKLENVLDERDDDETVGRREDGEAGRSLADCAEGSFDVALPIVVQEFGMLARLDMNGDDF